MLLDEEFPPDVRVENEIKALQEYGYKISLLCFTRKKDKPIYEIYNGVEVHRIKISNFTYKLRALCLSIPYYFNLWSKQIEHLLSKKKYDVIHLHDLPLIKVAYNISTKHNIKLIADFHENRPEIMKHYHHVNKFPNKFLISIKQWQNYQKRYVKIIDKLILITEEAKEYYSNKFGISESRIFTVPNYSNLEKIEASKPDNILQNKYSGKFVIVYFGDTGIRRGTLDIVDTAITLQNYNDIHFVIIGTSREQQILVDKAKHNNLGNIEFTGWIDASEAFKYIKISSIGISPLHRNIHHDTTYANKIFQYMACGLPIIVSDCPSQANIVKLNNCGGIHQANNISSIKEEILKLYNNKNHYKTQSKNAKKAAYEKYNFDNAKSRLIELYDTINTQTKSTQLNI